MPVRIADPELEAVALSWEPDNAGESYTAILGDYRALVYDGEASIEWNGEPVISGLTITLDLELGGPPSWPPIEQLMHWADKRLRAYNRDGHTSWDVGVGTDPRGSATGRRCSQESRAGEARRGWQAWSERGWRTWKGYVTYVYSQYVGASCSSTL